MLQYVKASKAGSNPASRYINLRRKPLIIISIDPQIDKSAGAFHWHEGGQVLKPYAVCMFDTKQFIKNHAQVLWGLTNGNVPINEPNRIAIIEGQYVGVNKKDSLALCKAANRMAGALIANGFEVIEAPVWGAKSWLTDMFSISGVPQKRAMNKEMSVTAAKQIWPNIANSDEADAVMMGQWWWSQNKYRYLGV
jgi:hypothetical protein